MTIIAIDVPSAARGSADPLERLILRLSRFEPLDLMEKGELRRAVRRSTLLPAYADLLRDASRDVSVVLTGMACQFKLMGNGRRQITGIIMPGDICDYGFLTGSQAQGQFITMAPSQIGRISTQTFNELAETYPRIMRATLRAAATEAAMAHERVISLGLRTAVERVAHLLCEIWYRLDVVGLVGPGNSYDFPITQAELGETLGLSTVHVNRTLQVLRRDEIITMRNGKVTISDLVRLHEQAGFDASYLQPGLVSS